MLIKYEFNDGTVSEVEVSEEIGEFIVQSRREEHALDERERYHRKFSIDGANYEENIVGCLAPEYQLVREENRTAFINMLHQELTQTQRERLQSYAEGKTYREIAAEEGVQIKAIQDSVAQARKIWYNYFWNTSQPLERTPP